MTSCSGNPVVFACRRTSERRTPCIATLSAVSLNVVRSPTTSQFASRWSVCNIHALSLPLLHETMTRLGVVGRSNGRLSDVFDFTRRTPLQEAHLAVDEPVEQWCEPEFQDCRQAGGLDG